ncbi:type B-1 chloramphenicol O-acetyltransferase CatB1 [Azospirillum formosense]
MCPCARAQAESRRIGGSQAVSNVMENVFESPFKGITLDKQVTNPNIVVGRYSYYSGYYHGHSFDDCARFLLPDEGVDRLVIGSFCSIGSGAAFIMAGNQGHRNDWISTFPFFWMPEVPSFAGARNGYRPAGDTVVGNDVWIGSEAIVMPGVTIGDGAVIGTRALVTRDVEPYAIVGGNPARVIRKRFDDDLIALLLEMRWWDWSDDQLQGAMPILTSCDVARLHRYWRDVIERD